MMQRCYLYCEEGDWVYVGVWRVHSERLFVLGGGLEGMCAVRGLGGVPDGPQGDLALFLSLYTFLKELYSFYLRKRDQPIGKWGQRWET